MAAVYGVIAQNQREYFSKKDKNIVQVDREHAIETEGGEVLDKRSSCGKCWELVNS